jgi:hypothetical protein
MNFKHSKDDSNVISSEVYSNITVSQDGRSIYTPIIMGLNLHHKTRLWQSNISDFWNLPKILQEFQSVTDYCVSLHQEWTPDHVCRKHKIVHCLSYSTLFDACLQIHHMPALQKGHLPLCRDNSVLDQLLLAQISLEMYHCSNMFRK